MGWEFPRKNKGMSSHPCSKGGLKKPISTTLSLIYTKFIHIFYHVTDPKNAFVRWHAIRTFRSQLSDPSSLDGVLRSRGSWTVAPWFNREMYLEDEWRHPHRVLDFSNSNDEFIWVLDSSWFPLGAAVFWTKKKRANHLEPLRHARSVDVCVAGNWLECCQRGQQALSSSVCFPTRILVNDCRTSKLLGSRWVGQWLIS